VAEPATGTAPAARGSASRGPCPYIEDFVDSARDINFFTVELIDAQGARVEYTVYFKLSRAPSKARLNLYVQSAYVQDDVPQRRPRPRKPIRFSVIAYNVAAGKAIKVPK
jgi:hypothetical protein